MRRLGPRFRVVCGRPLLGALGASGEVQWQRTKCAPMAEKSEELASRRLRARIWSFGRGAADRRSPGALRPRVSKILQLHAGRIPAALPRRKGPFPGGRVQDLIERGGARIRLFRSESALQSLQALPGRFTAGIPPKPPRARSKLTIRFSADKIFIRGKWHRRSPV